MKLGEAIRTPTCVASLTPTGHQLPYESHMEGDGDEAGVKKFEVFCDLLDLKAGEGPLRGFAEHWKV
jgi:hypothetical protein